MSGSFVHDSAIPTDLHGLCAVTLLRRRKLDAAVAHVDRVYGIVSCDLLDRLAVTDRLQGDSGLNSGLWVGRLLIGGTHDQGRY